MGMPWTRLEGTDLWKAAAAQYAANRNAYHDMIHVGQLYFHAVRLRLPYDPVLDRAILAHDVILDGKGHHEERSADWLDVQIGSPDLKARALIMTTVDHDLHHPDRRLALLDLADFTSSSLSRMNTRKLFEEGKRRKGVDFDQEAWVMGTLTYLRGLQERILRGYPTITDNGEAETWRQIARGISITMEVMPYHYARHPASGARRFTRGMEAVLYALSDSGSLSMDDLSGSGESLVTSNHQVLSGVLSALEGHGLLRKNRINGCLLYALTDDGIDWVSRMRAPQPAWPEPLNPDDLILKKEQELVMSTPHKDDVPTWHYMGDMNLENGGLFYQIGEFDLEKPLEQMEGCAWSVDVFPLPGDEEAWHIRHDGHVFVSARDIDSALDCCGYERRVEAVIDCTGGVSTGEEARRLVVEAFHAYRGVENTIGVTVTREELEEKGLSLEAYVRSEFLGAPNCIILKNDPDGKDAGPQP